MPALYSLSQSTISGGEFFASGLRSGVLNCDMGVTKSAKAGIAAVDEERMAEVAGFTAKTLITDRPVPFGALIVHTKTGKTLLRAVNAVARENDPSSHAELRAVRLACKKLKAAVARRLHDVHNLRAVPDVHGQCALGQAGPRGLRSDDRRCGKALPADSYLREDESPRAAIWPASSMGRCCASDAMRSLLIPT
jgi:hypothetical protein